MDFPFKKGDAVAIKNTVLSGTVQGLRVLGGEGNAPFVEYRVTYADVDGVAQERYFGESQLTAKGGDA